MKASSENAKKAVKAAQANQEAAQENRDSALASFRTTTAYQGDEPPANFPTSLAEVIDDWQFDTDADQTPGSLGLWLHSDSGSIDAACAFIQHLLQKFNPEAGPGSGSR